MYVVSPFQLQGKRKRVRHLLMTGSCKRAGCQLRPPSVETSTRLTLPRPDQARPVISMKPRPRGGFSGQGLVITDFASRIHANWRALPSASKSVYFDVSSLVIHGSVPNLRRRSHLTFTLPCHPGTIRRTG